MQRFPDEASCISYLKEQREQSGVVCKRCGGLEYRWDANKLSFECKRCHSRQSLRSGTVMEHSTLPFRYWIATMFLLTSTKKSFSTEKLSRQLGHKRYQPIWEMVCKLRDVMGKRDDRYQLTINYSSFPPPEKPINRLSGTMQGFVNSCLPCSNCF